MPKQLQNHQLTAQSTTPHPNQPHTATNTPSQMAQLAERIARIQARFDSSPAACASRGRSLRRKGAASASAAQKSQFRAELGRHRRKCLICAHPDRDAIEELFLHWHNPEWISRLFDLDNIAPIYRHAHATGLYARRRSNLRMSLEHLIEQADAAECTGAVIVRAVRAYACLTDSGEWVEPVSRVEFSSTHSPTSPPPDAPVTVQPPPPLPVAPLCELEPGGGGVSNRKQKLLETPVSCSKQTPELISNRKKIADNRGHADDAKIAKEGRQHEPKRIL